MISVPGIIHDYFPYGNHDTAIGLVFVGSAIGMTLFPPIMELLIDSYGWRTASMLLGVACLNISAGACFFKPTCKKRKTSYKTSGQSVSCDSSRLRTISETPLETMSDWIGLSAIMIEPVLIIYLFAFSLWGVVYAGWTLFLFSYAVSLEFSTQAASMFSAVGGLGTFIGRCVIIIFLKRQWPSPYLQFLVLSAGGGLTIVFYPFAKTYWTLMIVSFLAGVFIGTPPATCVLIIKDLMADVPQYYSGALGLQYMSVGIGMFAGGPMTGSKIHFCFRLVTK